MPFQQQYEECECKLVYYSAFRKQSKESALTLQALTTNFRSCRQRYRFGVGGIGAQCSVGKLTRTVDTRRRNRYWTYRYVRNLIFKGIMTKNKMILTH